MHDACRLSESYPGPERRHRRRRQGVHETVDCDAGAWDDVMQCSVISAMSTSPAPGLSVHNKTNDFISAPPVYLGIDLSSSESPPAQKKSTNRMTNKTKH